MEITLNSKDFASALSKAFSVVKSKPIIPILASVILRFWKDRMMATGSSGTAYVTATIDGEFQETAFCVDKPVLTFVESLPAQQITLVIGKTSVEVVHQYGRCKFPVFDESEYNIIPSFPSELVSENECLPLQDAISVLSDFRKHEIGGLEDVSETMWLKKGSVTAFHAKKGIAGIYDVDYDSQDVLLTPYMCEVIKKMDPHSKVQIASDEKFLHIKCGNMLVSEIQYKSKWRPLASPELDDKHSVTVDGQLLSGAIKRLSSVDDIGNPYGMVNISASGDCLVVTTQQGIERVPAVINGPDFDKFETRAFAMLPFCKLGDITIYSSGESKMVSIKAQDFIGFTMKYFPS